MTVISSCQRIDMDIAGVRVAQVRVIFTLPRQFGTYSPNTKNGTVYRSRVDERKRLSVGKWFQLTAVCKTDGNCILFVGRVTKKESLKNGVPDVGDEYQWLFSSDFTTESTSWSTGGSARISRNVHLDSGIMAGMWRTYAKLPGSREAAAIARDRYSSLITSLAISKTCRTSKIAWDGN